jgi:hypothetical protein
MAISDSTLPSAVPKVATELLAKVTWIITGSEVKKNGITIKENYAPCLERLEVQFNQNIALHYNSLQYNVLQFNAGSVVALHIHGSHKL